MHLPRRAYLQRAALLGAALLPPDPVRATPPAPPPPARFPKRLKLGIATYSYWHFREPKVSVETVMDKAAALGVAPSDGLAGARAADA